MINSNKTQKKDFTPRKAIFSILLVSNIQFRVCTTDAAEIAVANLPVKRQCDREIQLSLGSSSVCDHSTLSNSMI
mgnify:CR=1 FL=1